MIGVALILSLCLNIGLVLALVHRTVTSMAFLDRAHERTTVYTEGLVDRLMANDYGNYQAYRMLDVGDAEEPEPEEPQFTPTHGPDRGGLGSRLGLAAYHGSPQEQEDLRDLEEQIP